jgi:sugar lactone lactonase YvrE
MSIEHMQLNTLVDGLSFPEGPRWYRGELYFSDFYTHTVHAVTASGGLRTVCTVAQQPSGLGWLPDGRLLIVSMIDRKLLAFDGRELIEHADLAHIATCHCNDMVVDGHGRAYVGNFGFDRRTEEFKAADLALVLPSGESRVAATGLAFPNGSVVDNDGKVLIVGETQGNRLTAWDIDADGSLSNQRVWAALGNYVPDGICLDAEGCIWSADPRNNAVVRVREGGEIVDEIDTGERGAYACMLGGPRRRTLYICTNTGSGPDASARRDGRIEYVEVGVPGAGWPGNES